MKFQNRKGEDFDWDNEELIDNENVKEVQENMIHPDMIAKIHRVELESKYENTVGAELLDELHPVKNSTDQAASDKNFLIWARTTSCHIPRSKEWMTSLKLTRIVIRKKMTMMIAFTCQSS